MKVLDLFSGIGGFSLAAHWLGWETVAFVEKDKFCQKVLRKNFGEIPIYDDITTFDGTRFRKSASVISAGIPCQPFSTSGKRRGKNNNRFLWPDTLRIIAEVKPNWVVIENVIGIVNMDLDNMLSDLAGAGYQTQAFIIPACGVNAPHRRYRVWVVANSNGMRELQPKGGLSNIGGWTSNRNQSINSNADSVRRLKSSKEHETGFTSKADDSRGNPWSRRWDEVATHLCRMDARIPNRVDRLRALGNSIVPQIAYEIFRAINEVEK